MRAAMFLVAVAIITWLVAEVVSPPSVRPLTPSASVPTFQQAVSDNLALQGADARGQLVEDPALRARREAVVAAWQKLEASRCDGTARDELRVAVSTFLKAQMSGFKDKPTETMTVDGRVVDARGYLNRAASDVVTMAFADGILNRDSLPFPLKLMAPPTTEIDSRVYDQRYGCNPSTAKAG